MRCVDQRTRGHWKGSRLRERHLPEDVAGLLEQVFPVLKNYLDSGKFVIGGGSVLAARWRHRRSFGVDLLTVSSEAARSALARKQELESELRRNCGESIAIDVGFNYGRVILPGQGSVEWAVARRIVPVPDRPEIERPFGLRLDCTEEILAHKLRSRVFESSNYPIRDIFDLAWAACHEQPAVLQPALRSFEPADQKVLMLVIEGLLEGWIRMDTTAPIMESALPDFEGRAPSILLDFLSEAWKQEPRPTGSS